MNKIRGVSVKFSALVILACLGLTGLNGWAKPQGQKSDLKNGPEELLVPGGPIAISVLVQSPADTNTELQIMCLFRSEPRNTLHGSLVETNQKLKGLLDKVRNQNAFRGDLGETLVIVPPHGTMSAKKLLIIGLGDSESFDARRMQIVGSIAYQESIILNARHPFFAPTILDGGVTKFPTGDVAEQFMDGFLRAARTSGILRSAGASAGREPGALTFLAGAAHAQDTERGIEKAVAEAAHR